MTILSATRKRTSAILLAAGAIAFASAAAAAWKEGQALPDLSKAGLDGTLPASLKGKVILVDFWASWCPPCKASLPVLDALQKKFKDAGLVVLGISVDDRAEDMAKFLKDHPVSFPVVRDAVQKLVAEADVSSLPSSFVVDRSGRIRHVHVGFHGERTEKEYTAEIEALLKEKP